MKEKLAKILAEMEKDGWNRAILDTDSEKWEAWFSLQEIVDALNKEK